MGTPFTISEICSKVMCSDLRNEKKGHCSSQDTMVNLLDGKKYYMHLWKIYIIKNTISQAIYFHSEKFKFRINLLNHKSIKSCEKKSNSEVPKVISQSPLHICTPSWTQEWPGSPCLAVSAVFPLHPQTSGVTCRPGAQAAVGELPTNSQVAPDLLIQIWPLWGVVIHVSTSPMVTFTCAEVGRAAREALSYVCKHIHQNHRLLQPVVSVFPDSSPWTRVLRQKRDDQSVQGRNL